MVSVYLFPLFKLFHGCVVLLLIEDSGVEILGDWFLSISGDDSTVDEGGIPGHFPGLGALDGNCPYHLPLFDYYVGHLVVVCLSEDDSCAIGSGFCFG